MNALRIATVLAAFSLLSACQTFPAYKVAQSGDMATVDVSRAAVTVLCTGGKGYSVPSMRGGKLLIPADSGRVTLYSFIYLADYNVSYSCSPGLSFQPKAGEEYLFNIELEDQRCLPELYRKVDGNRIGLAFEDTLAGPGSCAMPGK
jgi:hypothetical protein